MPRRPGFLKVTTVPRSFGPENAGRAAFMIALVNEISAPTRQLSDYVARALTLALPDAVAEKARHHVLDTLAAMISGSQLPPGAMAIDYVRSLGASLKPRSSARRSSHRL